VFRTPAGDYAPAAPAAAWARYCGLSVSVAALKDSLAAAEVDWEAVRAAYADGDARFPEWPGVKAFAQEQFPGVAYWDANSAYFDDPAWLDTFAEANIDGDVLESGDLESRVELLEKTALDQVAANLIMGLIEAAADEQEGAWDAAAAVYTGCGTDNTHGAPRNALYDRSDRRGMHFGTIQNGETSMTNAEIMEAFQGGYSPENAAVVARAVQRTAWQSLLRYAHFLDGHFEFETDFLAHQAEGLAFWRILEAAVAQVDPERAALITAAFTSSEPEPLSPSNYCYILTALEEDLVADPAFGSFEDAAGIDCGGEGELAATGDVVVDDDDDDDVQEQEQEPQGYLEQDFFADFDWSSGSSGGGSSGGGGGFSFGTGPRRAFWGSPACWTRTWRFFRTWSSPWGGRGPKRAPSRSRPTSWRPWARPPGTCPRSASCCEPA
jgi:uncharacterized membrane protein YgcG